MKEIFEQEQEQEQELYNKRFELENAPDAGNLENTLQLALLYTLAPWENYAEAINVLEKSNEKDFKLQIIRAYLYGLNLDCTTNPALVALFDTWEKWSGTEKAMIKYVEAYAADIRCDKSREEVISLLTESIFWDSKLVNNFLQRYFLTHNYEDWLSAKKNVTRWISDEQCAEITIDELIDPQAYIEEFITGTTCVGELPV